MPVTNPVLVEQFLFGIKTESSYGTLASLAATDFMYVDKCEVKFESEDVPRDYKHADLNALESVQGSTLISLNVEGEYTFTSASVYAPMDAIEQAAGMTSSITAGKTTYSGSNSAFAATMVGPGKSATVLAYHKNELVAIRGVHGDYEETHASNDVVRWKFSGKGLYQTWSTATQPSATIPTASYVRVASSSFSMQSYIPEWSKIVIKYGNTVEAIPYAGDDTGYSKVIITKRRPTVEFDPLLPGTSTHDYIARLVTKTKGAFALTVGTVAGYKIVYAADNCQYTSVDVAERQGLQAFNVTAKIIGAFSKTLG